MARVVVELEAPGRPDAFREMRRRFREHLAEAELPRKLSYRAELIVEELLENLLAHGFREQRHHRVRLSLEADSSRVLLTVRDDGRPFDPTQAEERVVGEDLETEPIGGLGIQMLRQAASELSYARERGWNVLRCLVRDDEA